MGGDGRGQALTAESAARTTMGRQWKRCINGKMMGGKWWGK